MCCFNFTNRVSIFGGFPVSSRTFACVAAPQGVSGKCAVGRPGTGSLSLSLCRTSGSSVRAGRPAPLTIVGRTAGPLTIVGYRCSGAVQCLVTRVRHSALCRRALHSEHGSARLGTARHGAARLGTARHGPGYEAPRNAAAAAPCPCPPQPGQDQTRTSPGAAQTSPRPSPGPSHDQPKINQTGSNGACQPDQAETRGHFRSTFSLRRCLSQGISIRSIVLIIRSHLIHSNLSQTSS